MKLDRWIGLLAVLVVAVGVILAFLAIGSPSHGRSLTLDQIRVNDLQAAEYAFDEAYGSPHSTLPVRPRAGLLRTDPVTGKRYEYHRLNANSYVLCATFDASNDTGFDYPDRAEFADPSMHFKHGAGRTCYRFDVTNINSEPQPVR